MNQLEAFDRLRQRLQAHWQDAPDKPEETPDSTLQALWHAAAERPVSVAAATDTPLPPLDDTALARLDALLDRRLAGEPLAHITGRQAFMGLELVAGPAALIPRRETELLGTTAIALANEAVACRGGVDVIDVCTGSGNLALAIAHAVPASRVSGSDLSEDAVALARRNAALHGLDARVAFRCGDLLQPFDAPAFHGAVDVLVCNPPYISSGKVDAMAHEISGHEPRLAFDGGPLGVSILARLMQEAPRYLRAGGWLGVEVGAGQGPSLARRLRNDAAWDEVREVADHAGTVRALFARRAVAAAGEPA